MCMETTGTHGLWSNHWHTHTHSCLTAAEDSRELPNPRYVIIQSTHPDCPPYTQCNTLWKCAAENQCPQRCIMGVHVDIIQEDRMDHTPILSAFLQPEDLLGPWARSLVAQQTSSSYGVSVWRLGAAGPLGLLCQWCPKPQGFINRIHLVPTGCQSNKKTDFRCEHKQTWRFCHKNELKQKNWSEMILSELSVSPIGMTSLMQPYCSWFSNGEL